MKNKDLFQRDPSIAKLLNDGVAAVREAASPKEIETLRYELEHFVCEGQYEDGLIRILESYLGNVSSTTQPAAWVSGFYGSGKSHLLKMFRHLWVDTNFYRWRDCTRPGPSSSGGAGSSSRARHPWQAQRRPARRFGHSALRRRRKCSAGSAEYRAGIQGPARVSSTGAVLHVAPKE